MRRRVPTQSFLFWKCHFLCPVAQWRCWLQIEYLSEQTYYLCCWTSGTDVTSSQCFPQKFAAPRALVWLSIKEQDQNLHECILMRWWGIFTHQYCRQVGVGFPHPVLLQVQIVGGLSEFWKKKKDMVLHTSRILPQGGWVQLTGGCSLWLQLMDLQLAVCQVCWLGSMHQKQSQLGCLRKRIIKLLWCMNVR